MNIQQFQDAGFRAYKHPEPDCTLFSKTIRDPTSREKLYFIHATQWAREGRTSIEFEAHLYLPEDNRFSLGQSGFMFTFVLKDTAKVEDAEAFVKQAYELHGCIPDIHNND